MSTITFSRGSTNVAVQLEGEGGDAILTSSVGKPQQNINPVGQVDPRVADYFASVETLIGTGYIDGDDAYVDARTLIEDLIKPHSGGSALTLDASAVAGFSSYQVAPASESAVEITYPPGQRDWVEMSFNLPIVDTTVSGGATDSTGGSESLTPGDGGTVTVTNPANSASVTLTDGLEVVRSAARTNSKIRPDPDGVTYIDKVRSAQDTWEISGEFIGSNARTDATTLREDILGAPLGRDALTLTFDNNLYGYGSYNVVPAGSEGGRVTITASEPDVATVRGLTLRTVTV